MVEEHGHQGFLHRKLFGLPAPVVLGAGGLLVVFVLAHRGAAAGGAVDTPAAGTPDLGGGAGTTDTTANNLQTQQQQQDLAYQGALQQLDLAARGLQLEQLQGQVTGTPAGQNTAGTAIGTQGGNTVYSYGNGVVQKAWQQVQLGGQQAWEDIFHPGHIISEQEAQQLAPTDHGPYATPAEAITIGNLTGIRNPIDLLRNLIAAGASTAAGAPITLGSFGIKPPGALPAGKPSVSRPGAATAPAQAAPVIVASVNQSLDRRSV